MSCCSFITCLFQRLDAGLRRSFLCLVVGSSIFAGDLAVAQRGLKDIPDPDPALQEATFEVAEGFEINLYAADPMLAKPIQINFDSQGRLWVAASEVYPQIKPGQVANDKVLVLSDQDGDGVVDQTDVFADGLLIPTGVVPGDGGCYVANSTELLHLIDTDGDGRADQRRVVLSGFGTEDTHHILHTLQWGPDGAMYMNQSIYIHSHIETPHGVRRMNGAGVWRFRPDTLELETFTLGLVNPWGLTWDRQGATFETDGAGGEGINYVFPGFVGMTSPGAARILKGLNSGKPKLCSVETIDGTHLPPEWRGNLITNDFRAHRVCRYVLTEQGSGFQSQELDELIKTRHVAFRPIDVTMGPDGAIYIADWYNPIIQHGEVDFRDPRRDHVHGRIWRVTAKGRDLVPRLDLTSLPSDELIKLLNSPEPWQRRHARIVLKSRDTDQVAKHLAAWVQSLPAGDPASEQAALEALWTYQAIDVLPEELLSRCLQARDGRIRAAATRVLYFWHDAASQLLERLAERVVDADARTRLEAVRALSRVPDPHACELAMRALDYPVDRFLDFAIWQTARDLEPVWLPALQRGEIDFDGNVDHLTFALQSVQSGDIAPVVSALLQREGLSADRRDTLLRVLARVGNANHLRLILDETLSAGRSPETQQALLRSLLEANEQRDLSPEGNLDELETLLNSNASELQHVALEAIGRWQVTTLLPRVAELAEMSAVDLPTRAAAIDSLSWMSQDRARKQLENFAQHLGEASLRLRAAAGLLRHDVPEGTKRLAQVLAKSPANADPAFAIQAVLRQKGAAAQFAQELQSVTLPRDVAMHAVRTVQSSGRSEVALVDALTTAGALAESPWNLNESQRQELLEEILATGNPARGELIYRREEMMCQKCHAIGGAGGQVGPELASIGASAQPDYLLESLLEPGKKIKENYHSLIVETDRGQVVTGIKVRESEDALILRNADDEEVRVPFDSIEARTDGGSLMPIGLADRLTRTELVDLVRFLTELGKVGGQFSLSREPLIREWSVLQSSPQNAHAVSGAGVSRAATHPEELTWQSVYSRVSGDLPLAGLPTLLVGPNQHVTVLQASLPRETAEQAQLILNPTTGREVWLNGEPVELQPLTNLALRAGSNTVTVVVQRTEETDGALRMQIVPAGE